MGAGYAEPERKQLSIVKGQGEHYWIAGSINGHPVQFLVDTGATSMATNENQARRPGIDYRVNGSDRGRHRQRHGKGLASAPQQRQGRRHQCHGRGSGGPRGLIPHRSAAGHELSWASHWREEQGRLTLESKI